MKVFSPCVRTSVKYPSSISILARSTTAASVAINGRYPHAVEASRPRSTSTSVPARAAPRGVLRDRIHPDLRTLLAPMGHRQQQPTELRDPQRSARPRGRGERCHRRVMIRILLRHNAEHPGSASDVDAPMRRIIEQIIGIAYTRDTGYLLARLGIQHQEQGRCTDADKQAMMGVVQCHGEIGFGAL